MSSSLTWSINILTLSQKMRKSFLPDRESNPGLPRDRRRSSPLDYRGLCHKLVIYLWPVTMFNINDHQFISYKGDVSKKKNCVGRESNPDQLLGRQLCWPLYHRRLWCQNCTILQPIEIMPKTAARGLWPHQYCFPICFLISFSHAFPDLYFKHVLSNKVNRGGGDIAQW